MVLRLRGKRWRLRECGREAVDLRHGHDGRVEVVQRRGVHGERVLHSLITLRAVAEDMGRASKAHAPDVLLRAGRR